MLPAAAPSIRRLGGPGSLLTWIASLAALAAAWLFLAPPQLGGSTSYVVVYGTSMEPKLHGSDLVLLRSEKTYRVGEVVAYRSGELRRPVLHRIVGVHAGRYTFKGDNNSFLDPERPARDRLIGRLWLRVPAAGRVALAVHVPVVAAVIVGLLVLLVGLGRGSATTARRS